MARKIKVTSGIINIRLHPHEDGTYQDFIEKIYDLKQAVRIHGDRYAMLSLLNKSEKNYGIYTGLLSTFTKIDTSEPWFDAKSLKEASNSQISEISIPDNLYPNASAFNFLFDTKQHRLYIQTYSKGKVISIRSALTLISRLSDNLSITKIFGDAKITVIQSREGLSRVFSLPVIKRVTFTLMKPNADIFDDDFDENVEKYLEDLNSKKLTITIEAEAGKSIPTTPQIQRIGQSALEHGSVQTEGRDENGATYRSTEDFPKELHGKYDPDATSENLAFRSLTGK